MMALDKKPIVGMMFAGLLAMLLGGHAASPWLLAGTVFACVYAGSIAPAGIGIREFILTIAWKVLGWAHPRYRSRLPT